MSILSIAIDLDGVINNKVHRANGVDLVGISSEVFHGISHGRQIHDGGDSPKIKLLFKLLMSYVKSCRRTRAGLKGISLD